MSTLTTSIYPANQTSNTAPLYGEVPVRHRLVLLIDPSRRFLKVPLKLDAEKTEGGYWLVSHPELTVYGAGKSIRSATKDFQSMLTDLFKELIESENVLAPHLKNELDFLRTYLAEDSFR